MGVNPIPKERTCPHCGLDLSTHHAIGVRVSEIYEGILYWQCPECGGLWHRWDMTSVLRYKAERHIRGEKQRPS